MILFENFEDIQKKCFEDRPRIVIYYVSILIIEMEITETYVTAVNVFIN